MMNLLDSICTESNNIVRNVPDELALTTHALLLENVDRQIERDFVKKFVKVFKLIGIDDSKLP